MTRRRAELGERSVSESSVMARSKIMMRRVKITKAMR
jgi:hypothetical protein